MAKIVILEDDHILLDLYSTVLENAGYSTFPATTLKAVQTYFEDQMADLIIADLRLGATLPEQTVKILETIQQVHQIPAVLISAKMTFYEDMCREAGFEHLLKKPFRNGVLVEKAQELISDS